MKRTLFGVCGRLFTRIFHNISRFKVKKNLYPCFLHEKGQKSDCDQVDAIY
ncbi:hypothetical protein IJ117_01100 [Candidatus Saccharibacteria bacterium]|nr:hypothetical protein [Candidatus Saccharibacteria bacterium]